MGTDTHRRGEGDVITASSQGMLAATRHWKSHGENKLLSLYDTSLWQFATAATERWTNKDGLSLDIRGHILFFRHEVQK